nr:MAG TPA: hypothetical protein [Microviridae sp.]
MNIHTSYFVRILYFPHIKYSISYRILLYLNYKV